MVRRSKLGLVFALVLGLVAALVVWNYTQRLQGQLRQAEEKAQQEQVGVLVAAKDLPPRTRLTREHVTVIQIPAQAKHPKALATFDDIEGKVTQYPIASGEQILATKFVAQKADSGLAYVIPPGKRAMAVKVSEVIGAGGLIMPGDRVDILGTFDKDTMGKDMSAIILQDIEVLAVAQTYEGEPEPEQPTSVVDRATKAAPGVPASAAQSPARPTPRATATPTAAQKAKKNADAKTVTMAVTPEEAQRLALAEENGNLRLTLRPANDKTVVEIPEATLSTIRAPIEMPVAQITGVRISPTNARAGDTLKVEITVKNSSNQVIKSQGPDPEFTYVQGQTFHAQNFPSQEDRFRVGINFEGRPSAPFPYRWGLGGDLPPGATTTVTGYIKLTYDLKPTNFWAGLIHEPSNVVQDNVGTTLVTVVPSDVAVIAVDAANVRSGPDLASSVLTQLKYGQEVPIVGQEKDWYQIKLPDGRIGFVAAGWIVAPSSPTAPTNPQ